LCYWYYKCSNINNSDFHYKEKEIRKSLIGQLANVEKNMEPPSTNFFSSMEELNIRLSGYSSELMFASLADQAGLKVSFHRKHDILIDNLLLFNK